MHEQPLNIAIHNPKKVPDYAYLVKDYYNDEVPLSFHDSLATIVNEMEKGETQIGIFALPKQDESHNSDDNWWINLANNKLGIKIYAKIPFIDLGEKHKVFDKIELVCCGNKRAGAIFRR